MRESVPFTLGPERRLPVPGCPGFYVRISEDVRKTVVFFGFEDTRPGKGGINCVGSGFVVGYDDHGYLVTAKHLAHDLGNNPFVLRLNRKDGTSQNVHADSVEWFGHPDPTVDVAVTVLAINDRAYDILYVPFMKMLMSELPSDSLNPLGVGDLTYTVGLFRLMSGEKRNLPFVHMGNVGMMPRDEKIPLRDWRDRKRKMMVEGYLVETQGMTGLSGSPVFVRPTASFSTLPPNVLLDLRSGPEAGDYLVSVPVQRLFLLGLWSSSWDAPPDEVFAAQAGPGNRVPVGIGVVVPAQKIRETLDLPELVEMRRISRQSRLAQEVAAAATPDSAVPLANPDVQDAAPSADDANPNHLEDFKRLVDVAARKRPQDD
jgi:hypothetical protein